MSFQSDLALISVKILLLITSPDYVLLFRIIFVHKAIVHLVSNIQSMAVPTGLGDTLGNKGGIGIALFIAESSFCFINAHLAAHQNATIRRTNEFRKISHLMATKIWHHVCSDTNGISSSEGERRRDSAHDSDFINMNANVIDDGTIMPDLDLLYPRTQCNNDVIYEELEPRKNPLIDAFNCVFWFGDLNFRINGTREVVDGMLENLMHDALLCNDQLTMLMRFNRIFYGFSEGPLNFFPTYKFDHISGEGLDDIRRFFISSFVMKQNKTLTFTLHFSPTQIIMTRHKNVECHHGRIAFYSKQI